MNRRDEWRRCGYRLIVQFALISLRDHRQLVIRMKSGRLGRRGVVIHENQLERSHACLGAQQLQRLPRRQTLDRRRADRYKLESGAQTRCGSGTAPPTAQRGNRWRPAAVELKLELLNPRAALFELQSYELPRLRLRLRLRLGRVLRLHRGDVLREPAHPSLTIEHATACETRAQRHRDTETQRRRGAEAQRHSDTATQRHRDTETQETQETQRHKRETCSFRIFTAIDSGVSIAAEIAVSGGSQQISRTNECEASMLVSVSALMWSSLAFCRHYNEIPTNGRGSRRVTFRLPEPSSRRGEARGTRADSTDRKGMERPPPYRI